MTNATSCPCGSATSLDQCCLPVIKGARKPLTAEQLLRARYTAFTIGEIDFILSSHHSKTREQIKRKEIEDWSKGSKWLGLKVLALQQGTEKDQQGIVTFHARYSATDGKVTDHREHALFEKENGEWKFLDAQAMKTDPIIREEPKTGRNDPCPCGSGKKYKKCCG